MNNTTCKKTIRTLLIILVALVPLVSGSDLTVRSDGLSNGESMPGFEVVLVVDDRYFPARVPPPPLPDSVVRDIQTVPFSVNYNPASCPNPVTAWPANAQTAFDYAISIWALLLNGDQTIEIDACWETGMPGNVLGSTSVMNWYRDFTGAPVGSTWYAVALANQLYGGDLNGDPAEMRIRFNSSFSWYYGLDGNTPAGQHDFVTVVLHETTHGLGFAGSMRWDDGTGGAECSGTYGEGCWGWGSGFPNAYDRFAENGSDQNLIASFGNPSLALGSELTGDDLFFDGTNANAANGGDPPKLYAPATWNGGSSFSHLNDGTFNGTYHALMTHALANGESAHHPGTITLGILEDIGWDMPDLSDVYVDADATGYEDGTSAHPFDTVLEGVNAVYHGGTVWIGPGTYPEALITHRPMTLRDNGGTATIGE